MDTTGGFYTKITFGVTMQCTCICFTFIYSFCYTLDR